MGRDMTAVPRMWRRRVTEDQCILRTANTNTRLRAGSGSAPVRNGAPRMSALLRCGFQMQATHIRALPTEQQLNPGKGGSWFRSQRTRKPRYGAGSAAQHTQQNADAPGVTGEGPGRKLSRSADALRPGSGRAVREVQKLAGGLRLLRWPWKPWKRRSALGSRPPSRLWRTRSRRRAIDEVLLEAALPEL